VCARNISLTAEFSVDLAETICQELATPVPYSKSVEAGIKKIPENIKFSIPLVMSW
jgi:hypothetical protein